MQPTEPGGQEAVGRFEIGGDGKFEFQVIDADGQSSQQSFSGNVTLIKDQYPLVRILRPPPQSLATPTAVLPVVLSAEDDCGISRLELFRSLNHRVRCRRPCDCRRSPRIAATSRFPCRWPVTAWSRATCSPSCAGGRQRSGRAKGAKAPWSA